MILRIAIVSERRELFLLLIVLLLTPHDIITIIIAITINNRWGWNPFLPISRYNNKNNDEFNVLISVDNSAKSKIHHYQYH